MRLNNCRYLSSTRFRAILVACTTYTLSSFAFAPRASAQQVGADINIVANSIKTLFVNNDTTLAALASGSLGSAALVSAKVIVDATNASVNRFVQCHLWMVQGEVVRR
jgi:hypothetical protein